MSKLINGDCRELLKTLDPCSVDLIFADPPFGIGYQYDTFDDKMSKSEYINFTNEWLFGCKRVLKSNGTIWISIGDSYAAEIKLKLEEFGFSIRNWIIWYYSFGVACQKKFSRSHSHLFYAVKDPKSFTFNDHLIRIESDRQKIYNDPRANPAGKVPNDTWTDSRICGTFKERTQHPCQLPESILERIILASSNKDDLVLDPFAGSGTTLAVAKKLGRRWIGFELSPNYCNIIRTRLGESC